MCSSQCWMQAVATWRQKTYLERCLLLLVLEGWVGLKQRLRSLLGVWESLQRWEQFSFVVILSSCAALEASFSWSHMLLYQLCQDKLKKRYCLPRSVCLSIAEHFSLLFHLLSVCPLGCTVKIWTVTSNSCFTNTAEWFCYIGHTQHLNYHHWMCERI